MTSDDVCRHWAAKVEYKVDLLHWKTGKADIIKPRFFNENFDLVLLYLLLSMIELVYIFSATLEGTEFRASNIFFSMTARVIE